MQTERHILWDQARGNAVRSVYSPVPVSVAQVFEGVHMGDTVSVAVSAGRVVGGVFTSEPVLDSTAALSLHREDGVEAGAGAQLTGGGRVRGVRGSFPRRARPLFHHLEAAQPASLFAFLLRPIRSIEGIDRPPWWCGRCAGR